MKKMKSIPVYLLFIILSPLFIMSCNDNNPMTPEGPYQFDSARYEWKADTLVGQFISELLVIDSNSIYLTDNNNLIHFDGSQYEFHYTGNNNFIGLALGGLNDNNIYVGGGIESSTLHVKPALKRWNGSAFELINIPEVESISDGIVCNYVRSDNEIWLGTVRGKIFKYDGVSNFEFYRPVDTTFHIYAITNYNNETYSIATKLIDDSTGLNSIYYIEILKYSGNIWETVFFEEYNSNEPGLIPVTTNNKIFAIEEFNGLYEFKGTEFVKVLTINEYPLVSGSKIAGDVSNNNLGIGNINKLYNWNGNKWSIELGNSSYIGRVISMTNFKSKYYCLSEYNDFSNTYLFATGTFKNR